MQNVVQQLRGVLTTKPSKFNNCLALVPHIEEFPFLTFATIGSTLLARMQLSLVLFCLISHFIALL
jgi:hypothetical protein